MRVSVFVFVVLLHAVLASADRASLAPHPLPRLAANSLGQATPSFLDRVRQAAPHCIDGPIPVYCSPGAEARARALQDMLVKAAAFYRESLGVSTPLTLAVLDRAAWKTVNDGVPYGMPFVDQRVVVLPARREGVVVDTYMAHAANLPDAVTKAVDESKRPFAAHVEEIVDLIGYHELGHVYVSELGVEPHSRWFGEMLATYVAYAFLWERLPSLAKTWQIVTQSDSRIVPAHRSLAAFERLYLGVGAANYVWYQDRFAEHVITIFPTERLEFLRRVRDAFPSDAQEKPTLDEVLDRLEKIRPGFKGWAAKLSAG
jgi:hypothetical protein